MTITHWSPARDQATTRQITPRAVFTDRGAWYVLADDHLHGEERTFRIDRIESLRPENLTLIQRLQFLEQMRRGSQIAIHRIEKLMHRRCARDFTACLHGQIETGQRPVQIMRNYFDE